MEQFDDPSGIFRDVDVLQKDWTPSDLPEREEELKQIHRGLIHGARGSTPLNMFIYGKSGAGKTVAAEIKTDQLEEYASEKDDLSITTVRVSCNSLNRSYHVVAQLVKELRGPGAERPRGYSQQDLFEMAFEELNRVGGTIIIVLDEIDAIGTDDDILYEIPRAKSNGYIDDDVKLSLIGISNDLQFRENLSPKVKDTLSEQEIEFAPYEAQQLEAILKRRAELALRDDVCTNDVIPLCAAFAAQDKGSARQAIDYLFRACRVADDQGEDIVTEEHVRLAEEEKEREFVEKGLKNLTPQDHVALAAVTELSIRGETPVRTRDAYPVYRTLAESEDLDPLVLRSFRGHLRDLELYNVLDYKERNDGHNKGSYYEYELSVPLSMILELFPKLTRFEQLPDRLTELATRMVP